MPISATSAGTTWAARRLVSTGEPACRCISMRSRRANSTSIALAATIVALKE